MPQTKTQTRQIPKLSTRAAFVPTTLNEENRTVELTWSTGSQVRRYDWWEEREWIEELSLDPAHVKLDRLNAGAPLLPNHNNWALDNVIGVVEKAWIQNGEGRAIVKFSSREDVQAIFNEVKDGILRNISVGYKVNKFEKQDEKQNGLPVYRAVDWEPMEISLVAIPADAGAQVRGEGATETNTVTIITRNEDTAMTLEAERTPGGDAPAGNPNPIDETAIRAEAGKQERARIAAINDFARNARVDESVVKDLIERGVPTEEAQKIIIEKWAKQVDGETTRGDASVIREGRDEKMRAATHALLIRSGVHGKQLEKMGFKSYASSDNIFVGARMLKLAEMFGGFNGAAPLNERAMVRAAIGNTTSDFSVLLENVMHKVLLNGYTIAPDKWRRFCSIGYVTDTRDHNRYRLGAFDDLEYVGEGGEYKRKPIPDGEKAKVNVTKKGMIVGVTLEAIINDDMGAIMKTLDGFGRSAARTLDNKVFAYLSSNPLIDDNIPLFHADHKNLATGAAVSVASLKAASFLMADQKGLDGKEALDIPVSIFLGGTAAAFEADVVNGSAFDPDANNKLQRKNGMFGVFSDIVSTSKIKTNDWYLFADKDAYPVIEVSFLEGEEEPYLERQNSFDTDDIEWKIRHFSGVKAIDYRGAVRNPGA